jgi:CxxC motif-containing protein (DUF1111 family)
MLADRVGFAARALFLLLWIHVGWAWAESDALGRRPFGDARDPPSYATLIEPEQARVELGHAVFNTQWVPAGTANAGRRDGLGPLFNAAACDACHNEGAHGRGPTGDGDAPGALVMQLEMPACAAGKTPRGDPRYGQTVNTAAIKGVRPEAAVKIHFRKLAGRYPDGSTWSLRSPEYRLSVLQYGPLSKSTILEPRLAPALFGVGLLEAVPDLPTERFGWQGRAISIRDQTTKAFARDMGLTSSVVHQDDCTTAQHACLAAPSGGNPEVSDELLDAVIEFQRHLAVPERGAIPNDASSARRLFGELGCEACHSERLPVIVSDADGLTTRGVIEPYTDLRLHDLGSELADSDVSGRKIPSRWRTAPRWGLAYRFRIERLPTFLHDGRARSIEEAILWHGGEAQSARRGFEQLPGSQRRQLLRWVESL